MPYALFSNDAKLSKSYPTEADVWKLARRSGLVVDVVSEDGVIGPRPVLDNDYEIRPCSCEAERRPGPQQGRRRARRPAGAGTDQLRQLRGSCKQGAAGRRRPAVGGDRLPDDCPQNPYGVALTSEA